MPMMQSDNTDFDDEGDAGTALATRPDGEITPQPIAQTPAQAKTDAIAALTIQAYAKASELKLTPEEDKALGADFPDEAFRGGAGGDERLIYIEHAFLRDRLSDVLGRGQWSLVVRSKWTEEYTTGKGTPAVRVYAEVMLVVRGCFVAEAVGEMDYYPNNAKTTYADAIEGSKTAAFRRCAKDFGIGLQAWKKGWSEGWWERKRSPQKPPNSKPAQPPQQAAAPTESTPFQKLLKRAKEASAKGITAYQVFWQAATDFDRTWLKAEHPRLKANALAAEKPKQDRGDANEEEYQGDQEQ